MSGFIYCAHIIGEDGYIKNRVDIGSKDDAEAMRLAEQLVDVDGRIVELWKAERLLARIEASGP